MIVKKMEVPVQNRIATAYKENEAFLHKYFDYPNEQNAYAERLKELATRNFKREELINAIRSFMTPFGISAKSEKHLQELQQEQAVTVVGGQQAGILTGPLYSVHKAITVILKAKEQREKLGTPVIPVFWIAGEDHDLNEINHVYTESNGQMVKTQIQDQFVLKLMASDAKFDQEQMTSFIRNIFGQMGETAYTEKLLAEVLEAVQMECTFTGFFTRLMNGLFQEEGLLFIDAAFEPLRKLESEYFCQFIEASAPIAEVVARKEQQLKNDGFGQPIMAEEDAAHLFYVHETGRLLLTRKDERFVNESAGLSFTKQELLEIARSEPSRLSNNVVTRPIMQDFVLPVLAFVGGAGELAYWAILKEAFQHFAIKMPIFVPRMSLTLVSRKTEKRLRETSLSVQDVMAGQAEEEKALLVEALRNDQFMDQVSMLQEKLTADYTELKKWFKEDDVMMQQLLMQNLSYQKKQFDYLKEKYEDAIYVKHDVALGKFDQLAVALYPEGQLQERVHHPYIYLNEYGPAMIQDLLALEYDEDGAHYLVYL